MNKTALTIAATLASTLGGIALAPQAHAMTTTLESRAFGVALSKQGDPYVYGAAGPNAFDCSGLTSYSYKRAGKAILRTAQAQFNHVRHIFYNQMRPGDLVFFGGVRSIYHVGLYAGGGKIINANTGHYRGRRVVIAPISEYTGTRHYGRV
jgi:cell wall-associated NlpC family hydrolase